MTESDQQFFGLVFGGLGLFIVISLVGGAFFLERLRKQRNEAGTPAQGPGRKLLASMAPEQAVTQMNQRLLYVGIACILIGLVRFILSEATDITALALAAAGFMSFVFKDPTTFAVQGAVLFWGLFSGMVSWLDTPFVILLIQFFAISWVVRQFVNYQDARTVLNENHAMAVKKPGVSGPYPEADEPNPFNQPEPQDAQRIFPWASLSMGLVSAIAIATIYSVFGSGAVRPSLLLGIESVFACTAALGLGMGLGAIGARFDPGWARVTGTIICLVAVIADFPTRMLNNGG